MLHLGLYLEQKVDVKKSPGWGWGGCQREGPPQSWMGWGSAGGSLEHSLHVQQRSIRNWPSI